MQSLGLTVRFSEYSFRYTAFCQRVALKLPGFHCGRAFYVPRDDALKTSKNFPDLRRATLYWNPTVQVDALGQVEIRFFTSDAKGPFQVNI